MPATTIANKIPYVLGTDKPGTYPLTSKALADAIEAALSRLSLDMMPLAGSNDGTLSRVISHLTVTTSVHGGVFVDLPSGPWNGIGDIEVTPRNSDSRPLSVSVESVTPTKTLLRFADANGPYYSSSTGIPITLRITGWK